MKIYSTYKVKIKKNNRVFKDTIDKYRGAVEYLLNICDLNWNDISAVDGRERLNYIESLIHITENNPSPKYDFDNHFYKFPSYLRRAAINEALGKISSYRSNLENWKTNPSGKKPSFPRVGFAYPSMYRNVMYKANGLYEARVKVYIRNTWDWLTIKLKKTDIDYIERHCTNCKECSPTLRKRGKEWYLDFPFEEKVELTEKNDTIVSVDLGINTAAAISVMRPDGTILGRHICKFSDDIDSLKRNLNRIKKAHKNGNYKTPRLWAKVRNLSKGITQKTAYFIIETLKRYDADLIVFAHIDKKRRGIGVSKMLFRIWQGRTIQNVVMHRAHRLGKRVSFVCGSGTSGLAFDGSGEVTRDKHYKTGMCYFPSGKRYNYDLAASYNIGARYFIREILKSLPERERLLIEAKVPQCSRRSTCTFSTLINLNAVLALP